MDNDIIQALLRLQELDFQIEDSDDGPSKADVANREALAARIPSFIIDAYSRIRGNQRFAVVSCDDGYCAGCQMRVPRYMWERVVYNAELERCEHCGRFLVSMEATAAAVA